MKNHDFPCMLSELLEFVEKMGNAKLIGLIHFLNFLTRFLILF